MLWLGKQHNLGQKIATQRGPAELVLEPRKELCPKHAHSVLYQRNISNAGPL